MYRYERATFSLANASADEFHKGVDFLTRRERKEADEQDADGERRDEAEGTVDLREGGRAQRFGRIHPLKLDG